MAETFSAKIYIVSLVTGALIIIAGLSWENCIQLFFDQIFPRRGERLLGAFIYALVITTLALIIAYIIFKYFGVQTAKETGIRLFEPSKASGQQISQEIHQPLGETSSPTALSNYPVYYVALPANYAFPASQPTA